MSFKIPCGGFRLDEKLFSLDKNDVLSIPKPLTYDYMPEGYPKKDGWSVEWDGNIDGKISAIGIDAYKFSDMVLTYEEFLSAMLVVYVGEEQYSKMVSELRPSQNQIADNVSMFRAESISVVVVSEDNAGANGIIFPTKGLYTNGGAKPFKLIKQTITPMSTDFIPNNLNVVFTESSTDNSISCNVTYNQLRGWIGSGAPIFATHKSSEGTSIENIIKYTIATNVLTFYYGESATDGFKYKSDGTIEALSR